MQLYKTWLNRLVKLLTINLPIQKNAVQVKLYGNHSEKNWKCRAKIHFIT